jgi:hypothetical protein
VKTRAHLAFILFMVTLSSCHHRPIPNPPGTRPQSEALVVLRSECRDHGQEAHRTASIVVPWSSDVKVAFHFSDTRIALPNHEWSDEMTWGRMPPDILTEEGAYPVEWIHNGLISFDGSHVTQIVHIPSMTRSNTQIALPRPFRIGRLKFQNCVYYFNQTDFGKRKRFTCDEVGMVAEDEDVSFSPGDPAAWVPSIRVVAAEKIHGDFPKFPELNRRPPYDDFLIGELTRFSKNRDFRSPCQLNFEDFIKSTPPQ